VDILRVVSSQLKIRPESEVGEIEKYTISKATCLRNEPFSFQIAYRLLTNIRWRAVSICVKCNLPIQAYRVDYASVINTANDYNEEGYIGSTPGLYPNPLMPRPAVPETEKLSGERVYEKDTLFHLDADTSFRSLWVSVNPESEKLQSGIYEFDITCTALETGEIVGNTCFTLEIIDALLPEQKTFYTNWFHVDCLCDYYKVEPYTEEFYKYFKSFIRNAVMHRQNTLLIPAFTPPLDTPPGGERRNVQLVDIKKERNGYTFNFDKLNRFLKIAQQCGIAYFEHCHLFSQWGAKSAPNIYDVSGKRLFGWETDSSSPEYSDFLENYLVELLKFIDANGYNGSFIFHMSDEPSNDCVEEFLQITKRAREILNNQIIADALSHIEFYREGIIDTPIAFMPHADKFSSECENFWLYYTGGTYARSCTNRLITNTAARTRVLGLQLYLYGAKGFLHWGYNYYYNILSTGFFDPMVNPCGYENLPGASFLAYPSPWGALPSVCEKHMCEAFDDIRALQLLESHIGKQAVMDTCRKLLGDKIDYTFIPENNNLFNWRQAINEEIRKHCKKEK